MTGGSHGPGIWFYRTTDGGKTWREQSLPVPSGYSTGGGSAVTWPPVFFGEKDGFFPVRFGAQQPPATIFYVTRDGGESWNPTAPLAPEGNKRLVWSFVDPRHGFAADGERLYQTTDGGRNWAKLAPDPDLAGVRQLAFVNSKTGWALVSEAGSTRTRLLKTVDGGSAWNAVIPGLASKNFDFILKYGVGAKNVLDTFAGTFTRDLIMAGAATTRLALTPEEMGAVYAEMVKIDIFGYPERFTPRQKGTSQVYVTPHSTYYLKLQVGGKVKEIFWEDTTGRQNLAAQPVEAVQLRNLIEKIIRMVEEKEDFKKLPEAEGGYV